MKKTGTFTVEIRVIASWVEKGQLWVAAHTPIGLIVTGTPIDDLVGAPER